MNDDFFYRIKQFIDFKNLSNNKFAEKIGVSSAQISYMLNGSKFGIDKLLKIISVFPELNEKWLLTGEGDMLKSGHELVAKKEGVSVAAPINNEELINYLKEQLKAKETQINEYVNEIKEYVKQVTTLEINIRNLATKVEELEKEITFLKKANPQVTYSINAEP